MSYGYHERHQDNGTPILVGCDSCAEQHPRKYAAALKLSPEGKYLALLAAARAVLECPDYRAISTLEMKALRRAVEEAEK